MFKKLLQRIKEFFNESAEYIALNRYLSGAKDPCELEERFKEWERRSSQRSNWYF